MYKLLLVDDEKQITEGLKCLLDWEEFQITQIMTANSYEEALEIGAVYKPDIAILDVRIRNKYGFDLHRELKELQPDLCSIMISGYDEFEYVRKAMRQGVVDYLLKPIDRRELRKTLEKLIVERLHGELRQEESKEMYDEILQMSLKDLSKLVQKIIAVVSEDYGKSLNLTVLAEEMEVSSGYLGKMFLRETNMKFSQYLMQYRMKVAKELILNTDEKISYIARKVGYSNMNYFYIHFQLCHKKSPKEFRDEKP